MKMPMNWAKEFAEFECTPQEFADRMTMSGSKVETYECEADDIKNVVVGKILEIDRTLRQIRSKGHYQAEPFLIFRYPAGKTDAGLLLLCEVRLQLTCHRLCLKRVVVTSPTSDKSLSKSLNRLLG